MRNRHTLIVEAKENAEPSLVALLRDRACTIQYTSEGDTALSIIQTFVPDLVFLDMWLPGMDGMSLLRIIRQLHPESKVIMMSGHGNVTTVAHAMRIGAYDYIEKPFVLAHLLTVLHRLFTPDTASSAVLSSIMTRSPLLESSRRDYTLPTRRVARPQRTLCQSVTCYGQGLQSGLKTGLILTPLPPNHGILFKDLATGVSFPAHVTAVTSTDFCTSLASGAVTARTVEHLLSALHAYGVTNVLITLDGEVPIMDGSAATFCELLEAGQLVEQQEEAEEFVVERRYCVGELAGNAKYLSVEPYDGLRITYSLEYPPPLGVQEFTYEHYDGQSYRREIAPARTFAFVPDVEKMHEQGLIPGGRLNNVVLIDDGKIINHAPLRFADECVRHKILDLLGDLYLLGKGLRGHVRAYKTGHTENITLVKQLAALSTRPDMP